MYLSHLMHQQTAKERKRGKEKNREEEGGGGGGGAKKEGIMNLSSLFFDRLVGLVVKASASRAEDPGFDSRLRRDFSGVESYQRLKNWHSSCDPPDVIGPVLGMVGPMSVYRDWVGWKV